MNVWFTADTHFGHQRTLELSKRPFANVEQMDKTIIENWNHLVAPDDTVFHLGDFGDLDCFQDKSVKLNGKIQFLCGNYDTPELIEKIRKDHTNQIFIEKVIANNCEIRIPCGNNQFFQFMLIHEPENAISPYGFYLYGHIHKLQMVKRNGLNVGVDCHNFRPLSQDDVLFYHNAIFNHYDNNVFVSRLGC